MNGKVGNSRKRWTVKCFRCKFKAYLHGVCDAGCRLMFKFRSGTHGLNEELGRQM